ncbi:MAG: YybH family protein [Steroidobacteraceae bacterium]
MIGRSKLLGLSCVAPCLLAGLAACNANQGSVGTANLETESQAIQAEANAWFEAIAKKDLEKTLSFYAADAQYLSAGRPAASTADERRRLWMEDFATPGFSSDETTAKIEVAGSGDLAYQRGTYVLGAEDGQGKATKSPGKFVVVWRKQSDGKWKAIVDIDNADQ